MRPTRVLAIGFVEATWPLLRSLADRLPTLARMSAEGASGVTRAPQPLVTGPMWATLVTGRDVAGPVRTLSAGALGAPPIWRLLEDAGVPTGTLPGWSSSRGRASPTA
jgi:hypothetical protein